MATVDIMAHTRRHDHSSMDMGGMSMGGSAMPTLSALQKSYWAAVGSVIAAFAAVNLYNYCLFRQRRSIAASNAPARPNARLVTAMASLTAILRETSNYTLVLPYKRNKTWTTPTIGKTFLVTANLVAVVVLCLYRLDLSDYYSFETIGYRTGYIAVCQLPLIFLLSSKRNIVAALIGSSYERINYLHRWASRALFLSATIHMGYWFASWGRYDYIGTKVRTDPIAKKGVVAWSILLWIMISSATPIRGWRYEIFVVQHIISMLAFTVVVYLHIPQEVKAYVWVSIGLFVLDRVLRVAWNLYHNISLRRRAGGKRRLLGHDAYLEQIATGVVKVTIPTPSMNWRPGQHVFLSCHGLAPLQAHPFTIASLPSDGQMEFYIGLKAGVTRKLYRHAEKPGLPTTAHSLQGVKTAVTIDGPYGRIRPLAQFDTVVLFAGSTGATFTVPLVRDIVEQYSSATTIGASIERRVVTRRVKLIWVVKSSDHLACFSKQLSKVIEDVKDISTDFVVDTSVYVTCDDTFTREQQSIVEGLQDVDPNSSEDDTDTSSMQLLKSEFKTADEKQATATLQEITPKQSCGPNGSCCCTADIDESSEADMDRPVCNCNCGPAEPSDSSAGCSSGSKTLGEGSPHLAKRQPLMHPAIKVFSGRPVPRKILRTVLEDAHGESAVVACGPRGLTESVRAAVVGVSDERAVHKGTGAQGVWLHTEAFGY